MAGLDQDVEGEEGTYSNLIGGIFHRLRQFSTHSGHFSIDKSFMSIPLFFFLNPFHLRLIYLLNSVKTVSKE